MGKLDPNSRLVIPAMFLPAFRTQVAIENGVERKLLFKTWGGIGDQICAEPTLRYAMKMFKDCEFYLASEIPELFEHLPFKKVFNLKEETPNYSRFLCFDTITPPDDSNLVWQFFSHMLTNCVDFPAMCALRLQLPVADKEIRIDAGPSTRMMQELTENSVVIHPGKHWQSKTFPKKFWDEVIECLVGNGIRPIIIGADTDDNRGTVDVTTLGCIDYRNQLSIMQTICLLQNCRVLLTNDSSPLHMAASGDAWIGYIATCKHPDYITHWRHGIWQWREVNFSRGGIWDVIDFCPNKEQEVSAEFVDPELLESWLPDPKQYARWAAEKYYERK